MNARTTFFFALIFTLLNVMAGMVMGQILPFVVAAFGAMATIVTASKVWPDAVKPSRPEKARTENLYGFYDEDLARTE